MRRGTATLIVLFTACAVGSCDSDDDSSTEPTSTGEPGGTTVEPTTSVTTPPNAVEIAAVFEGFEYYGACGNETVEVGGTMFYPLFRDEQRDLDGSQYPKRYDDSDVVSPGGLLRVPAPGPGDDIGTMIVYSDGMARFESDSGRVIWLTDREHRYNWVC